MDVHKKQNKLSLWNTGKKIPNLIHEIRKTRKDTYTAIIRRGYFTEYFKFAKRYDEKVHTGLQEKAPLHIAQ